MGFCQTCLTKNNIDDSQNDVNLNSAESIIKLNDKIKNKNNNNIIPIIPIKEEINQKNKLNKINSFSFFYNANEKKKNELILREKKLKDNEENYQKKVKEFDLKNQKFEHDKTTKEEELNNKEKQLQEKDEKIKEEQDKIGITKNELEKEKNKLKEENEKIRKENEDKRLKINIQQEKIKKQKEQFEKEQKEKESLLAQRESNINKRDKAINQKEKAFNNKKLEFDTNFKQKEKDFNQRKLELENEFKNLEEKKKEFELIKNKKEKNINERKKNLDNNEKALLEKENKLEMEFKEKENNIREKENNFKEKEKNYEKREQNILKREKEISIKEEQNLNKEKQIKFQENELTKKYKKLEIDTKLEKENIEKLNKQLLAREEAIRIKEEEIEMNKKPIIIGLNNIGATCYMNATLQSLSNSKKLTEYFLKTYKYDPNKVMANEYQKVLINLWNRKNNNKSYSPTSFKEVLSRENPLFAGIAANDSKDLINFLIERFHLELNEIKQNINNNDFINQEDQTNEQLMLKLFIDEFKEKFNSPISNLFYGILETKSQCLGCKVIKYNFQIYSFLEFPLQQVNQYFYSKGKRPLFTNDGKNPDVDLYECFEYYGKVDLMTGDNQMYCNICSKLLDSYYSTIIYSSPIYLIINLNRGKGATYECKVNFPEQLNLFNFVTYKGGYTAYGLYAVICHLGPSSMSGHFVAYCRNRTDNKWYIYNDAIVSLCTRPQQYTEGMPYILFYKALTLD